jgi:PKD repeat protein
MFKRIVSTLSLSPSAVSQLTFYARRLKAEKVTRTFTAIGAILVIGLQSAVILAPPTPTNAASPGDIIRGGIVSKDDLLNRYDESAELQSLYARLGITRTDITHTKHAQINTKDRTIKSLGRIQHEADEYELEVGKHTYFMRPLYLWDTGKFVKAGSTYDVLEGTRASDGKYFAVMYRCGNIVMHTYPPKPVATPTPKPTPKPTPAATPTPKSTPKATPTSVACTSLTVSPANGVAPLKAAFTGVGAATGQTIARYDFDFGDGQTASGAGATATHTYATAGSYTATLRVNGSAGSTSAITPACSVAITPTSVPPSFTKAKAAVNLTQNLDATTKPAAGGDLVKYNLTTKNIGGTAGTYVVVEHIEDVLEYADVTDAGGATLTEGVLSWPSQAVAPGQVLASSFTVKIKNPIPATPVGLSDPGSFDLRLDNIYGNGVQISLVPPSPKQIEAAATNLPDTGASAGTIIILLVCAFSLYFFFRNRQLLAEVKLLRGEYHGGL